MLCMIRHTLNSFYRAAEMPTGSAGTTAAPGESPRCCLRLRSDISGMRGNGEGECDGEARLAGDDRALLDALHESLLPHAMLKPTLSKLERSRSLAQDEIKGSCSGGMLLLH